MRPAIVSLCSGLLLLASLPGAHAFASGGVGLGPLQTSGAKLLDAAGQEVRITGVNWFGMETDTFAPHGLWSRNYGDMLDQIASAGFNTIRLPFSNQLLDPASVPKGIDYSRNADLKGLTGLQILDRIVAAAGERGLSVILDRHRPSADSQSELWYTPRVSESRWIQDWVTLARRYAANPTVIGADLHNEPHGPATWGDGSPTTDWRLAAERAGNAILDANPDWLIIVEGIEHSGNDWYWWGGNLVTARTAPIRLSAPDKLVYSTHDYGPGVYRQNWFLASNFPANLPDIWHDHWSYLSSENIAPILVGEFGGRSVGSDSEGQWQRSLLGYLRDNNLSYTYWAWNPDSGDTGGILADDWSTLNQQKLAMLSAYQWPSDAGAAAGQESPSAAVSSPQTPSAVAVVPDSAPVVAIAPAPTPEAAAQAAVYAPGGPFDPDIQHVLQGIGGPNDPDLAHRLARQLDEQLYLAQNGKPWQYAAYAKGA